MLQLKLNDDFTNLLVDIPHWKDENDIPINIKNFIINTSDNRVIYETSTHSFYCGKCVNKLNDNGYCPVCNIKHKKYDSKVLEVENKDITVCYEIKKNYLDTTCNYFIFDIVDNNVILYLIKEEVSYNNPFYNRPYKSSKLDIILEASYLVEKDGLINLETNDFISFKMLDEFSKELDESKEDTKFFDVYEELELISYNAYLYIDNLVQLKNTVYQYSRIWELCNYLIEIQNFTISQLTLYPLYYAQFEYLVNFKLYNLACDVPHWFRKGKNFKEIFGVEKKYLSFMVENNITTSEFRLLQLYPTTDIELLRFFADYSYHIVNLLRDIKIDLKKIRECLLSNGLTIHNVIEYVDYIGMAKELRLDLEDKEVLYPKNLREAHDELYNQIEVIENPVIDDKIKKLSSILSLNSYEDKEYIIYPASSIEELVEESRQQKNCVRTYCERLANNESHIYFMRKKSELNKSLVTIEVYNNKIVQARVKYNELPSEELNSILRKWEKTMIPIMNEKQ